MGNTRFSLVSHSCQVTSGVCEILIVLFSYAHYDSLRFPRFATIRYDSLVSVCITQLGIRQAPAPEAPHV